MKKSIINGVILFIVIIFTSAVTAYATSNYFYTGTDIGYDNSQSGLESDNVQGAIDDLREKATNYNEIREEIDKIKSEIQPVGSIYMSVTDDTVAKVQAKFGGTWQKIEGRFLLSSSGTYKVNTTGGSADAVVVSHTHTVSGTAASAGAHKHSVTTSAKNNVAGTTSAGAHRHWIWINGSAGVGNGTYGTEAYTARSGLTTAGVHGLTSSDGAHSHNLNIPALSGTAASAGAHTHSVSGTAASSGVSGSGKNMPPYYTVHVYKRVS